MTSMELILCSN